MTTDPDVSLPTRLRRTTSRARRAVLRRRRVLAAALAGVAALAAVRATAVPPPQTVAVPVLARDVAAGSVLGRADLVEVAFAPGTVPDDVVADPVGRAVATAVSRGEPVTAGRLVGPALVDAGAGRRALPVRLPDAGTAAILRVGDRVDLLAVDPQGSPPAVVATDVRVLAVPDATTDDGSGQAAVPGRLVVVGVAASEVTAVADAAVRLFLTWTWSH